MLLAALEQFVYEATNRLLLAASDKCEGLGTIQKDVKKKPAKMLPPTLSKQCMCTISIFVVNDHGKQLISSTSYLGRYMTSN